MNTMKRSIALAVLLAAAACKSTAPSVAVTDLSKAQLEVVPSASDYLIKDSDTLNVRVFGQDNLSGTQRVRGDGKIMLPMAGEITARGKRPGALAREIEVAMRGAIKEPQVTVTIEPPQGWGGPGPGQFSVSVLGQVKTAGAFNVDAGAGVFHALAAAGGLNDYADEEAVFVVRKGFPQRVRFRFSDLRAGEKATIGFQLMPGDVIVVE